jgi:hypothetical protein
MVLIVEPRHVPSPKGSLHWEVQEVDTRVSLETHTADNPTVSGARLIFQEKVILQKRKVRRNASQRWTKTAIWGMELG